MPNSESPIVKIAAYIPFRLILGVFLLGGVMMLPSGIPSWFDGLPWNGNAEFCVVLGVIPFLFILGRKFLSLRSSIIFLAGILILKTILFVGAPAGGWLVKVYPKMDQERLFYQTGYCVYFPYVCQRPRHIPIKRSLLHSEGWIKTFATAWNQNASGILQKPWEEKLDFPLDWAIPLSFNELDDLNPAVQIEGTLLVPEGKQFALVAVGIEEGSLLATNKEGKNVVLSPAKSFEEAKQMPLLADGSWRVSGTLRYGGSQWSLIPVWVDSNQVVSSDLGRESMWQDESILSLSSNAKALYVSLSWVVDVLICLFLFVWAVWTMRLLINEQVLTMPLASFSIFALCISTFFGSMFDFVLEMVHSVDLTKISHIGIATTLAGTGFMVWSYFKEDYRNFHPDRLVRSIFLLFGLPVLFFFFYTWWPQLGNWWTWSSGDDFTAYQFFARRIIVGEEWLSGGQSAMMGKELYPYVTAISYGLFGQSKVSWQMLDVWSVLGAATLLGSFVLKLRLSLFIAFLTSMVYLTMTLIGSFRYIIGRGLSEYVAMILMLLAAWFLYRARKGGWIKIFLATFFGILGYWTRQDHLGIIVTMVILTFEPIEGPTGGWKGYWERFKINWQRLAWYWGGGIIIGVGTLCVRNWLLGGDFNFAQTSGHPRFNEEGVSPLANFYTILTGNDWPNLPSLSGVTMTLGALVALVVLVWRHKSFLNFPLGLSTALVGLFAPYLFISITAYAPRWSIHFLPLAVLSLMIFLNGLLKDNRIVLKFNAKK